MLITDKIIYLELQKTGCTHTLKVLSDLFKDNYSIIGKHNRYDSISPSKLGDFESKFKLGNIRNPWDWYVSLWAFGCQQNGELFVRLTTKGIRYIYNEGHKVILKRAFTKCEPRLDIKMWQDLYSDPNNAENFRKWLKLLIVEPGHYVGEEYKAMPLSKFAGFLTHRYLGLYTYRKGLENIDSREKLIAFDKEQNFMDRILRNEFLHDELLNCAEQIGSSSEEMSKTLEKFQTRTNKSSRDRDYRKYYDDETISIVKEYESFIINKYGYSFE